MKFSEMEYRRIDADKTVAEIKRITNAFEAAADADAQYEAMKEMSHLMDHYHTMHNIAYVRYTVNTKDDYYKEELSYCQNVDPTIETALEPYQDALLGTKFRSELEKRTGAYFFEALEMQRKTFSEEITDLICEENELVSRYQGVMGGSSVKFQGKEYSISEMVKFVQSPDRAVRKEAMEANGNLYHSLHEEFDEIYDKLVQNRTQQAKKLGLDSYVDLAYLRHKRSYSLEDVRGYRRKAVEELLPIAQMLAKQQAERIGVEKLTVYDFPCRFVDGNANPTGTYDDTLARGRKMYEEMSEETKEFIQAMFDGEMMDVLAKPGKTVGGYCISIPEYGCPFIFANFNGTAGDVDVFTHEAGHAYAFYKAARGIELSELRSPTAEACEVHSMTMEFFAEPWYETFFGEQTEKYKYIHLATTIDLILRGCQVDHFQEEVYLHPELTPKERNDLWRRLETVYRPYRIMEGVTFYEDGAEWQSWHHFFTHPYYFIDYCLAQTVALQFWTEMREDWDAAWKKYNVFVNQGGTKSFLDLVKGAGLQSPLEDGCLKRIGEQVKEQLMKYNV